MKHAHRWSVVLLIIGSSILLACTQTPTTKEKIKPATVEKIEGSDFSRVVLTEKAAERIGIQTTPVRDEKVVRTQAIGSEVVALPETEGTASNTVWVRVPLSESDQKKVDRNRPARVLPVDDQEDSDEADSLIAEADEGAAFDDAEETAAALYYVVNNTEHKLTEGQRVFVELSLLGSGTQQKVVPYAAVIYGLHGETWVYTNPEPLVFVRRPIVIDYIEDDLAVLSEGPDSGTAVVTVGAAELFGAETGVSK